jgi:hypothetical protein
VVERYLGRRRAELEEQIVNELLASIGAEIYEERL